MMGLEILVRPLVVPSSAPVVRGPLSSTGSQPAAIDGGAGRLIDLRHSRSVTFSHTLEREIQRKYDTIRIHNPSDPSQYVDDEVVTELLTQDQNGNIIKRTLQPAAAADNVEVLSRGNVRVASNQ